MTHSKKTTSLLLGRCISVASSSSSHHSVSQVFLPISSTTAIPPRYCNNNYPSTSFLGCHNKVFYSTNQQQDSNDASTASHPQNTNNNTTKPKVKIINMMNDPDATSQNYTTRDDASPMDSQQPQIQLKGTIPFKSLQHMNQEIEKDWTHAETMALDFIHEQLDETLVPDYIFKGLLILYNRTRQYNLQDTIFTEYFYEGSSREVDVDIVNSMIHAYIMREQWEAVHQIMHQYFGWSAPRPQYEDADATAAEDDHHGEATDIEPKMFPNTDTIVALASTAKDELSVHHLNAILEEFSNQSHHGIINEDVIYGFMQVANKQLLLESVWERAAGWMGYDGNSMTVQSEIRSVGAQNTEDSSSADKDTAEGDKNEQSTLEEHRFRTRSQELYDWIWDIYYTYFGNKMGDYAWIPDQRVVELMIHSASFVGDSKNAENLFETFCEDPESEIKSNNLIVSSMIRAYSRAGQVEKARRLFARCADRTLLPEGVTQDILYEMIEMACMRGEMDEAVALLRTWCATRSEPEKPVPVTIDMLNVLLDSFRKKGDTEKCISLFEEFCGFDKEANEVPFLLPSIATVNYAMECYVKEGDVDVAFQIFEDYCDPSSPFSVPVSLYTVELIVQGLFQVDQVDKAIGIFETFCIDPDAPDYCKPTIATLHMVLRGLQKKNDANRCLRIFGVFFSGNVPELYVEPHTDTVNIVLKALLDDRDYFKCRDLYEEYFNGEQPLEPNDETRSIMSNVVIDEREYKQRKEAIENELHARETE